ncbi:efflux RND transporter permease subunit [Amnibacterium kyonggiense]|uniref:efflux RND transporter permease subunit n=1 Tax=Amnibacterium kyonggiense TaxID=595671 RepID=UPI0013C31F45|nr:efflux RND transporter permease subunit [Amnibacterium kyonggiense]
MQILAAFSLRNRALIALVTVVAAFFGVLATTGLRQELIPSIQFPQLAVVSTYRGASPEIVSERVSKPIEQAVRGIRGVDTTSSTSATGSSTVSISFAFGTDLDNAEQKVSAAINGLQSTLPDGVQPQVVAGSLDDFPIVAVSVTGDASTTELATAVNDSVLPKLEKLDGVRAASLAGAPGTRITIVPKDALADHGLQTSVISQTLQASGALVPGGTVTENGRTRAIEIGTELGGPSDIAALPLSGVTQQQWNLRGASAASGSTLNRPPRIGDVATVRQEQDPVTTVALVNGKPALTVSVTKLPDANTVQVSREVADALPDLRGALGPGGAFTPVFDQAPFITQSIDSLLQEGGLGLIFAVVVILLFLLSIRATLVSAISIPTSVLITLIGMQAAQYSLNILTLGAITIAVGRVVDDSIVVTENIARHFREDLPGFANSREDRKRVTPEARRKVVLDAVREVAGAVTASTATTVAVFLPIAFVGSTAGELFRPFALTVTMALASSLLVALTIVPVLSYWFLRPGRSRRESAKRLPPLQRAYRPILSGTLRHPWLTVLAALVVLVLTGFLVPRLQTNYLGSTGQNTLTVTQTVADGTSLDDQTADARTVDRKLRSIDGVRIVAASIGTSGNAARDAFVGGAGSQITYNVTTAEDLDQDALQQRIRERLGGSRGEFEVSTGQGFGTSSDIEVDIAAGSVDALDASASRILEKVRSLPSIAEASSNLSATQQYLAVRVNADAAAKAGFTEASLAQYVAAQTQPTDIGSITVGNDSITVYLQAQDPPKTLDALKSLDVPTATGTKQLSSLATVALDTEPATVTSTDGARSATVTATPKGTNTGAAIADVQKAVDGLKLPGGASATLGGLASDQTSAFQQLFLALLAAILIVYTIMVATFRSLRQPLLLLISVPFAATGAILLQLVSGIPLGVASVIGLIMLVGIVVTNAIVLIDLVRQYREKGETVRNAVLDGASRRLRPILMTALATIFALVPLASGLTGHGGFISQPLAIVVIGGLVSSTVLTLIVLPTLYFLVEGRRERRDERRARKAAKQGPPLDRAAASRA